MGTVDFGESRGGGIGERWGNRLKVGELGTVGKVWGIGEMSSSRETVGWGIGQRSGSWGQWTVGKAGWIRG